MEIDSAIRFFAWSIPVVFAITLHEVAHGAVAFCLGDTTAKHAGRLSINPLKHIEVFGSIIVPVLLFFLSGFIFGWAKPVPVNERNLYYPDRDIVLVALAGPMVNLVMSIIWAVITKLGYILSGIYSDIGLMLISMGAAGVFINAAIMVLNLLPFPPLDGGRILMGLLPNEYAYIVGKIEPWGFLILLVMIVTGVISKIVWPMMAIEMAVVTYLVNTPEDLFLNALRYLLGNSNLIP